MKDQEGNQESTKQKPKSYREAVKPKPSYPLEEEYAPADEEDWDGNLLISNVEEMTRGTGATYQIF